MQGTNRILKHKAAALLVALAVTATPALAINYSYSNIQVPGAKFTSAAGINNKGDIVGYYEDTNGQVHGFVLSNGNYTTLDYPGAIAGTFAAGINDAGVVVGSYDNGQFTAGFRYAHGKFRSIRYKNFSTAASGINKSGQIVGYYFANDRERGFEWQNGKFKLLHVRNSTQTVPVGINKAGDVSGTYYDASGTQGFLLKNGTYQTIDVPASNNTTMGSGLNDQDYIVGSYKDPSKGTYQGFLMIGSSFQELSAPGNITTFPSDINDNNVIVGIYFNGGVNPVSFVATPQ